jgi:hypothetical protein
MTTLVYNKVVRAAKHFLFASKSPLFYEMLATLTSTSKRKTAGLCVKVTR